MKKQKFTHVPIPGKLPKTILPNGCALILEGGGTRGFYSAGVFEAFMDQGIMFPYIAGVSAGAANAITYISGQALRNRQVVEYYVGDHHYVSKRNFILHHSLFNMEFIFHTVMQEHIALDWNTFDQCNIQFLTGAMDCHTGKSVWFEKKDITKSLDANIASCSVPIISPIVKWNGYELLDGGISDPIPIEKSIADGNQFHVIVLTRNPGYTKAAFRHKKILQFLYHNYPCVVEAICKRHETYNRQLALCEQLEREGKAVIIRPLKPLNMKRTSTDIPGLLNLYDEGHKEGRVKLEEIIQHEQVKGAIHDQKRHSSS